MKHCTVLAIDLAKTIFELNGVNSQGSCVLKKRLSREKLCETVAKIPPCTVVMEACGSAYYWARKFQQVGHEVKLISPQYVKPFVKGNKNDGNDAQAIAEAAMRPSMRFVPLKSIEQQDIQVPSKFTLNFLFCWLALYYYPAITRSERDEMCIL